MTRESYIVENFSTFTLSTFMSSHAAFIHLMPICILSPVHVRLLFHITLKNAMVYFSISAVSNVYPFITSYSCTSSFICFTHLHLTRYSSYRLHSSSTCSSVSTCPHPQLSSSYFHAIISLPLTGRHPPLTISLTLDQYFHQQNSHSLGIFSLLHTLSPFLYHLTHYSMIACQPHVFSHIYTSSILLSIFIHMLTIPITPHPSTISD